MVRIDGVQGFWRVHIQRPFLGIIEQAVADEVKMESNCGHERGTSAIPPSIWWPNELRSIGLSGGTAATNIYAKRASNEAAAPPGSSNVPDVKPGSITLFE